MKIIPFFRLFFFFWGGEGGGRGRDYNDKASKTLVEHLVSIRLIVDQSGVVFNFYDIIQTFVYLSNFYA